MNNQEFFFGKLGAKPELAYTKKSMPVCKLSVAVNADGEEKPIWKRVIVWGKQAELASVCLRTGSDVFVRGFRKVREYTTTDGLIKQVEEVNAQLIGFTNV